VYSLGVAMYELFALHPPFADKAGMAAIISSMTEDPEPADKYLLPVQGRVPREIAAIIAKAMARKPADRYRSMQELLDAIAQYEAGEAPVMCVHTGLKRLVNWVSKRVDNRAHAVVALLAVFWATPLVLLVALLLLR
jgi:serine/threonine protein kinase